MATPRKWTSEGNATGWLELLTEDLLVKVLETLAMLDPEAEGQEWQRNRYGCTRNALRFAATCQRLRGALLLNYYPKLGALGDELQSRALTDIQPTAHLHDGFRPYRSQRALEQRSQVQLRALDVLDGQMGFHCSGSCCKVARHAANRKLRCAQHTAPEQIYSVGGSGVRKLSAARERANVAFVYNRHHQLVQLVEGDTCALLERPDPNLSAVSLTSSPNGAHVAWTTSTVARWFEGQLFHSAQVWLWTPHSGAVCEAVSQGVDVNGVYPTAVWWTSDNNLRVAWTSNWVDTTESIDHSGEAEPPNLGDYYYLATYDVDGATGQAALNEVWGPSELNQRLLTASPDETGTRVACLVSTLLDRCGASGNIYYQATVHSGDMRATIAPPNQGRLTWGPIAVGMSPSGDCVVAVHLNREWVRTDVFALDSGVSYTRVNSTKVDRLNSYKSGGDRDSVRMRYSAGFSGCGRYATITDQRAHWNCKFTGYTLVALDLAHYRKRRDLPAFRLCYCEAVPSGLGLSSIVSVPTPLRELHWGRRSAWVLAGKGVILISGENIHSSPTHKSKTPTTL